MSLQVSILFVGGSLKAGAASLQLSAVCLKREDTDLPDDDIITAGMFPSTLEDDSICFV